MLSKITLLTGLIGIGATIVLIQTTIAKSPIEIGDTAKAITVLITEPNSQGSGVILQRQGNVYTILTAAHVVRAKAKYKITTSDDRSYEVITIRPAAGNIDLAVVKFKSATTYPTAKLGDSNVLKIGMDLYVAGFPATTRVLTQSLLVFREGKVSANSNKSFDAGYSLVYSNDTLPGMSGGAVLNSKGELVAIHGRGDREERSSGEIGGKTGFNVGIPINRFAVVAKNMGVELDEQVAPIPQNSLPKADDYIVLAEQKFSKQDYQGSLAELTRAIQINPNLAIAYNYRGEVKGGKLQDIQGALADYNQAIEINPNLSIAYYNRGLLKENKLQDIQGALADFNRVIQLDPNFANAYVNLSVLRGEKLQDTQGALVDINRAIQLNPNFADAYEYRGQLKVNKLQDIHGGLADFNRSIQLNPSFVKAYNNRGFVKQNKLQDIQGALADFNRAIQLGPNDAFAYGNRGLLRYHSLQDRSGGITDLQAAARLFQQQGETQSYQLVIDQLKKWQVAGENTGF